MFLFISENRCKTLCVCVLPYSKWKFWSNHCSFMCPVIIRLRTANRRHQSTLLYLLNKLLLRGNCQSCYFLALPRKASASRSPATRVAQLQKPCPDARAQVNGGLQLYSSSRSIEGDNIWTSGFRLLHFVWQISQGMKSSSLAHPKMRGRLRQRRATAAELSVLVEEQPGEARAAPCEPAAVRGGRQPLWNGHFCGQVRKCWKPEALLPWSCTKHMAEMCLPTFSLRTVSLNCFLCLGERYRVLMQHNFSL